MISAAQMPFEIAGQLQLTSEGLRYVGVNSRTICVKHKFGYPSDIPVTESKSNDRNSNFADGVGDGGIEKDATD